MKSTVNGCRWEVQIRVLILSSFLLAACSTGSFSQSPTWQSELEADHPLVGRIWSSHSGEFIDSESLLVDMERARYILLGEKHDNPDHHSLQLMVLTQLLSRELVAKVSFEMLDSGAQPALDSIQSTPALTLDELKKEINWDEEGWDWNFYGPLVAAAHRSGVEIAAANISRETMSQVYAGPLAPDVEAVLDAATVAKLEQDIDESHCGMLPESQFSAMVRVQQSRDQSMAQSLLLEVPYKQAVLIAGNYHIRQDLGVPNYLLAADSQSVRSDILALSFMEVAAGEDEPEAYLQQYGEQAAYDYIWFTPAVSSEDYCASLRQ